MADPRNSNPFDTDTGARNLGSEYAANKALANTFRPSNIIDDLIEIVKPLSTDNWFENEDYGFDACVSGDADNYDTED